jgi:hypothetical protein
MRLSQLEFGAILTYSTHGDSTEDLLSKEIMNELKRDGPVRGYREGDPPIPISQWIAQDIQQNITTFPFGSFFQPNTIIVPTPRSSLMQPDTLWVPDRISRALARMGIGGQVVPYLFRAKALRKAAYSKPKDRPKAAEQYETMGVQKRLITSVPVEILLVDDVVTRGATLMGAANRLADVFPQTRIRAFAAMRAITSPSEFRRLTRYCPCKGTITLDSSGEAFRKP